MKSIYLLTFSFLFSTVVCAGELAGVRMPDKITLDGKELYLNGMALRTKFFFKVYVGGLYLPYKTNDAKEILEKDDYRHFKMHWLRSVDKDKICEAWISCLEANYPNPSLQLYDAFQNDLCDATAGSKTGDVFEFTYIPNKGTTIKGTKKVTIEGKEFADALFACWIGENPGPGEEFKQSLLGK